MTDPMKQQQQSDPLAVASSGKRPENGAAVVRERMVLNQTVRKVESDCYHFLSQRGEGWARIYLTEGVRDSGSRWGEIAIVSDYGVFGHTWTAIGERSFRDFLSGLGRDYVLDKLGRERLDVEAAKKAARKEIIARRRGGDIDRDEAREIYDAIDGIFTETADGWYAALSDALGGHWSDWEAWNWNAPNTWTADSLALWERLWPRLIAAFEAEACAHG